MNPINRLKRDLSSWSKIRAALVVGEGALFVDAIDSIRQASTDLVVSLWPDSMEDVFYAVAQSDLDQQDRLFIIYGGGSLLTDRHIPWLSRAMNKSNPRNCLVFTSDTMPEASDVVAQFKRSMSRVYSLGFARTDTGRSDYAKWFATAADVNTRTAELVSDYLNFDVERGYNLAQKLKNFEGLSFDQIKFLASSDYQDISFVDALLRLKKEEALAAIPRLSKAGVRMAIDNIVDGTRRIGLVYPATLVTTRPGRQQVLDFGVKLPQMEKWWDVAGRYPPYEQIRRQLLALEISSQTYIDGIGFRPGALESLVVQW